MIAETVQSAFLLSEIQRYKGQTILVADCRDFDHYSALPRVLKFEGKIFALTGWNSDTHRAYWKIGGLIATIQS